jgi:hypothetical protein
MEIKVSQKKAQKAPQLGSVDNYALGCRLRLSGLSFSCNPAARPLRRSPSDLLPRIQNANKQLGSIARFGHSKSSLSFLCKFFSCFPQPNIKHRTEWTLATKTYTPIPGRHTRGLLTLTHTTTLYRLVYPLEEASIQLQATPTTPQSIPGCAPHGLVRGVGAGRQRFVVFLPVSVRSLTSRSAQASIPPAHAALRRGCPASTRKRGARAGLVGNSSRARGPPPPRTRRGIHPLPCRILCP